MSAIRLAGIPVDHFVAEMAAFPLASEAALELGVTHLEPSLDPNKKHGKATRQLWRAAERHLIGGFPAFSVDEVVAVRDSVWFTVLDDAGSGPMGLRARGRERTGVRTPTDALFPLHTYLRTLAAWYLEIQGDAAVPRLPLGELYTQRSAGIQAALARERWRWLALAVPPDLLLAALGSGASGADGFVERGVEPVKVNLLSPTLETHLRERGFAEVHLHIGAALDFPLLWIGALCGLGEPDHLTPEMFLSPGAAFEDGANLAQWLVRAAVTRFLLAAFLGTPGAADLESFLNQAGAESRFGLDPAEWTVLSQLLGQVREGVLDTEQFPYRHYQALYGRLINLQRHLRRFEDKAGRIEKPFADRELALQMDPIETLLPARVGSAWSAEMRLVDHGLQYLEHKGSGDALFARLFWQVVRIRSLFYRHVIQRPMTPGLQWFIRFFGRMSPAKKKFDYRLYLQTAAELGGYQHGLRALEVRLAPAKTVQELKTSVEAIYEATRKLNADRRQEHPLEVGITFHFVKDREGGMLQGWPAAHGQRSNLNPQANPDSNTGNAAGARLATYYNTKQQECQAVCALLDAYPLTLEVVRGVDVCTDELGIPNWVLAPLVLDVREAGERAARRARSLFRVSLPPIRTTVHAGEDFVHLLTGLRQVDEAIEGYQLRSGDRIGHGIALGVDAREWARRAGRLAIPREERLWDLVWEWAWYGHGGRAVEPGRSQFLEREIAVLSERMFGRRQHPFVLERLRHALYDWACLRKVGFPNEVRFPEQHAEQNLPNGLRGPAGDDTLALLAAYLTSWDTFCEGQELVWVETRDEGEVLAGIQAELRGKVGARGLAVEVNPTSNLLIGNLGDLTTHPLWRLYPPRPMAEAPPVAVCIGSDDPLVFGSDLRQEYQALYDAMLLAGLADEEARDWLNRTRNVGLETRFTFWEPSGQDIFLTEDS